MSTKNVKRDTNTESYKELAKREKEKVVDNQKLIAQSNVLIRQAEAQKIKEYKENLPNVLKEKNEQIFNDVKDIIEKSGDSSKLALEPIIMGLLNRNLSGVGLQPIYTTRELGIVFEYYKKMITDLAMQGINVIPSRQNFSSFAGINTRTFENAYLRSNDMEKSQMSQTIEDYFIECSWSGAKRNKLNSYAVEKYNKIQGIGGGYVEPKINVELSNKTITLESPEIMKEKLEELKKNLF